MVQKYPRFYMTGLKPNPKIFIGNSKHHHRRDQNKKIDAYYYDHLMSVIYDVTTNYIIIE